MRREPAVRKGHGASLPTGGEGMPMAQRGGRKAAPIRPVGAHADDVAVTDVLGSLLLVGITVISAFGFGLLLLSFDGPQDTLHADLELRTDPGTNGWGTGDESLQVVHLGGEDVEEDDLTIRFRVGSTDYCFGAAAGCTALGSAFGDGTLSIGETWSSAALNLASNTEVEVEVIGEASNQLLATGLITGTSAGSGGGGGVTPCAPDTDPPEYDFVYGDLDTTDGMASFAVTLEADDVCGNLDTAAPPSLHYRVTPTVSGAPAVPDDYADSGSDLGAMTWVPGTGFTATIPAPGGIGWGRAYGATLQFYASDLTDTEGNAVDTAVESELIQLIGAQDDPPDTITLTAGAFTAAGPSSNLNTDDGSDAVLQEACMHNQPTGVLTQTQTLCATVTGGSSVTDAGNAVFDDAAVSSQATVGGYLEVSGFDVGATTSGDITAFTIHWEGQRGTGGATNPTVALEFNFGSDYSSGSTDWKTALTFTQTSTTVSQQNPVVVSGLTFGGPWTADQFSNLHVRARYTVGTRAFETDFLRVTPTYPSATTVRDLDATFTWTGLAAFAPSAEVMQLQMGYASSEVYTVEAYDGTTWQSCTSLAVTAMTDYTCDLSALQVQQGPQVRIRGAASDDTATPNSLTLDYMHMLVVT